MCTYESKNLNEIDYRIKLKEDLEKSHLKLREAVNGFNSKKAKKPINRDDLESFPLMVWVSLNEDIEVRKRNNRFGNFLNFDTKMKEGAKFGEHFHDDIIESAEVITGELLDTYDDKVYKKGDVAHYEKGQIHTPIALVETLLHVLFKP